LQQLQKLHSAQTNKNEEECVIYSIGSANSWGFEEEVFDKTNCRVETFDCTVDLKRIKIPARLEGRVRFHHICLSHSDYSYQGRKYVSWQTLHTITGLKTSPTFLKMDIEGYEFPVMISIVNSGVQLPLQIAMELHLERWEKGRGVFDRRVNSLELYSFASFLYRFGGYYLIDRNDNRNCPHCTELVLAKLDCRNFPLQRQYQQMFLNVSQQHHLFATAVDYSLKAPYYT
jgi:hypothetical protein